MAGDFLRASNPSNRMRQKLQCLLRYSPRCPTPSFLQYPIMTVCPYSVWDGNTKGHEFQQVRLTGPSWKLATTARLIVEPYLKEALGSYPKALKSLLKSLEGARQEELHCRVPSRGSKVPLHVSVSPKSHSSQQLLSKVSLLPTYLNLYISPVHPPPHTTLIMQIKPTSLSSQLSPLP